jgi:hypothetical protein
MKLALSVALLISIFCGAVAVADAQAASPAVKEQPAEGAQQFAALGDLKLRSGAVIHDFHLGYRTFGQLNAAKSNAILWPTWLGGTTQELVQFVGSDKVVDNTKYFVFTIEQQDPGAVGVSGIYDSRHGGIRTPAGYRNFAPDARARGDGNFDGRDANVRVGCSLPGFYGRRSSDGGVAAVNLLRHAFVDG